MRFIVTPAGWYRAYWTAMGLGFMVVNYLAMRHAVKWAIVAAATELGWVQP